MGIIIHGIYLPTVSGTMVVCLLYAVDHRIAHVQIGAGHVDLGAQGFTAIRKFSGFHAAEKIEIFCNAAIPVWAVLSRNGKSPAVVAQLFHTEVAYKSFAVLDQYLGIFIEFVKVIR